MVRPKGGMHSIDQDECCNEIVCQVRFAVNEKCNPITQV
jgi:hypothetical protein